MGCFNLSCGLSGLPILLGDRVRFLLLTQSPYPEGKRHRASGINGWWAPRSFPIQAEYNDYGSIDGYNPKDPMVELLLEALDLDVVTVGYGDNTYHDLPVAKSMDFSTMLKALWAGRIKVYQDSVFGKSVEAAKKHPPARDREPAGVPTIERIQEVLKSEPQFQGDDGPQGFMVDELEYGVVRVRWNVNYGEEDKRHAALQLAKLALDVSYASVITVGSGNYPDDSEIRVFAQPSAKIRYDGSREPSEKHLMLSQVLIREDVWQALLRIPLNFGREILTVEKLKDGIKQEYMATTVESQQFTDYLKSKLPVGSFSDDDDITTLLEKTIAANPRDSDLTQKILEQLRGNLAKLHAAPKEELALIERNALPLAVGLQTHWELFVKKRLPIEQAMPVIETVAEMTYISFLMSGMGKLWQPSTSAGSQGGEFRLHDLFNAEVSRIARNQEADLP